MIGFMLLTLLGCGSTLPTRTLTINGNAVKAEIVANDADRQRGLMYRDSMGADKGMLFIYPDDAPRAFWMKNTRIPLSIAFADKSGKIMRIADMKPMDTNRTKSLYPVRYALEMNKGWFETNGIEKGAMIEGIPTDIPVE